jgi:putative FmdB family regulatory protein
LPLYDYRCRDCSTVTEVRHGTRDAYEGTCPACGGGLARVFNAAGIVFKGSGFYVNDSRKKSAPEGAGSSTSSGADAKPASGPDAKPAAASETKPAPATPAAGGDASPKKSESSAA